MAIQQIDLAVPNGDTVRSANIKINENFTDRSNAASRLVGTGNGQVATWGNRSIEGTGLGGPEIFMPKYKRETSFGGGLLLTGGSEEDENPAQVGGLNSYFNIINVKGRTSNGAHTQSQLYFFCNTNRLLVRSRYTGGSGDPTAAWGKTAWAEVYTDKNTILENGYLKPSSPVLRLRYDGFKKEHEAEQLDIKVDNPEKGVYKITGTTGLRKNDGWYFSPPKDEHFNILCMVEIEEEGDIITVKTYAKKFDFEKVAIVPDYENPVDIIGEVLLRFNDLPQEQIDEPIE